MATTIRFEDQVEIPLDIRSLADFRRWATSDAFPQRGRFDYVAGSIEVDMSPEDLHTHGKLKTELVAVLWQRIKQNQLGELYSDRARVSCPDADLSVEPDLMNRGIGTRLMRAIEAEFPRAGRFELATGHRSERNLRLYERLGYRRTREEVVSGEVTLVWMGKGGQRRTG